jgi:nucleotide-binding universal stress UspA family protein
MKSQFTKKIIWAIDPFEKPLKSRSQLISTLGRISKEQKAVVEPVHILDFSLETKSSFKRSQFQYNQYREGAKKATEAALKGIQGIQFLPARILMVEDSTPKETVQILVDYATQTQALLFVVGTHARRGLPRLFLGSFSETLLMHSHIPVITISPDCLINAGQNQILFATDFSKVSSLAFQKVITFSKNSNADLTLFHVIPHPIEPLVQSGTYLISGGLVSTPDFMKKNEETTRKLADKWKKIAQDKGVKIKVQIDSSRGSISELILKLAREQNFGLIAMSAESGTVSSTLIGSVAREVVRRSPCPVWVLRPHEVSSEEASANQCQAF